MTTSEHHRLLNMLMILVAAALIVGLLYWWTTSPEPAAVTPNYSAQTNLQQQVADILRQSSVKPTQQEITNVATQLQATKSAPTAAQQQAVANSLRQSSISNF